MSIKSLMGFGFAILLVFLFCVYGCSSAGDAALTSPENLLKALSAAAAAGDGAKAEALFTKESWNEERDSGKNFFKQAARKKFELKRNDVRVKGEKAVVIADIIREGKVVDQLYFYTVKDKDGWKFDGIDENKNHIDYYLDGRLPARFYPSDYPASPELEELGKKLIEIAGPLQEAAADPEKQASLLKGVFIGDPGSIYPRLRLLLKAANMNLNVVSTHMTDSIQRGAIVIKDETGKEKIFIYAAKGADGWKLVNCYTGWLSGEALLR